MNNLPKKKPHNKYLQLTGIAFQMGVTLYLATYLGKKLDEYFQTEKRIYTIIATLLGLLIAIWNVLRQLKKVNH